MKEQTITLPQELQNLVIAHTAADRYLRDDLPAYALVSKKWLQEARRHSFSTRNLYIFSGASGSPRLERSNRVLRDLLYQDEPICTIWPYIHDMEVSSHGRSTPDEYISLLSLCLSRASHLQTLRVSGMKYSDLLKDAIANLATTKTITSIYIERCTFPSPEELDIFLGLFPQLRVKCRLEDNRFECTDWDGPLSYTFSPHLSLQFSICAFVQEDYHLEVFLYHQWNITDLQLSLTYSYKERMDFHLLTDTLKQIGASLKSLSLDLHNRHFRGPFPLSLFHNTSLQSLLLKGLAGFGESNGIMDLTWLATVLNTIEARGNFKDVTGILSSNDHFRPRATLRQWLSSFDWAPIEEAILDLGRFPGEPMFTLSLRADLKHDSVEVAQVLKDCMPRCATARRLILAKGSDVEDRQPMEYYDQFFEKA